MGWEQPGLPSRFSDSLARGGDLWEGWGRLGGGAASPSSVSSAKWKWEVEIPPQGGLPRVRRDTDAWGPAAQRQRCSASPSPCLAPSHISHEREVIPAKAGALVGVGTQQDSDRRAPPRTGRVRDRAAPTQRCPPAPVIGMPPGDWGPQCSPRSSEAKPFPLPSRVQFFTPRPRAEAASREGPLIFCVLW